MYKYTTRSPKYWYNAFGKFICVKFFSIKSLNFLSNPNLYCISYLLHTEVAFFEKNNTFNFNEQKIFRVRNKKKVRGFSSSTHKNSAKFIFCKGLVHFYDLIISWEIIPERFLHLPARLSHRSRSRNFSNGFDDSAASSNQITFNRFAT